MRPSTRCEAVLPQGKCVVLPLSFGPARGAEYVLRVGSAKLLLVTPTQLSERLVGEAVGHHVMAGGSVREPFNEMRLYTRQDASGWLLYAENRTSRRFTVRLDLSGSFNCLSSRGSLHSYDVIPPGHTQLLHALTMAAEGDSRMAFETLFGSDVTSPEVHSPEVEGLHAPHPIGGVAPAAARTAMPIQQLMHALGLRFLE